MRKITVMLVFLLVAGISGAFAQTRTVAGKVTSSQDGLGIPGVTVMVKGTTIGAITDFDGNYRIDVRPEHRTLVFSYVSMKTVEVALGTQTSINMVMDPDVFQIDEVVVTAIGIKREAKALGYAVQSVGGENVSRNASTNMINSMAGKVAGVSINSSSGAAGASSFMTIRGFSSITQNNQPLFVIDGVPIDNSETASVTRTAGVGLSNRAIDINPDDIESMNILKGGAATALYGIRAANGAVVITTKKGQASGKMNVSFTSSVTMEQVSQLGELQTTFAQGTNKTFNPGVTTSWGPRVDELRYDVNNKTPEYPLGVPVLFDPANPAHASLPVAQTYDNLNSFFQTGVAYNNALSLSGGNERSSVYFSLSNLTHEGIVPNNTFQRTTATVSGETKLTDKITTSGRISYTNSGGTRIQQGSNTSGVMLALTRMPISFDMTGGSDDPANDPTSYMKPGGLQRNAYGGGGYDNPFWTANMNPFTDNVDRMIGNWGITYMATDWLTFNYKIGTDFYRDARKQIIAIGSRTFPSGEVWEDHFYRQDINSDLMANMNFDLSEDFKLTALVGNNMYQYKYQNLYSRIGGLVIPDFYNLSNAASQQTSEFHSKKRTAALYGDLGLDYKGMVYLNFTARNEWSTTLPDGANSFFYPSFSGSFIFTELPGLADNNILPFGKIRASYAIIGNDAPIFATSQLYVSAAVGDGWTPTAIQFPAFGTPAYNMSTTLANRELKPERTTTFEVGVDLRFVDNRIGLDLTYFDMNSEDLILPVPIAGSSGYTTANLNAASMTNKGIEAVLKLTPVRTKDFNWNIDFNFTKINNEVTLLAEGVPSVFLGGFVGKQVRAVVGNPYGSIFGTDFLRDANDKLIIQSDPAKAGYGYPINNPEDQNIGNVMPNWTLGINNSFSYKAFSLSFLWDIKNGGVMWNGTRGANLNFGMTPDSEARGQDYIFDGVKQSGGTNDIVVQPDQAWYTTLGGGFNGPGRPYVDPTDWVRLRELYFGYSLPMSAISKVGLKKAEIYFTGRNLLLFTDYDGVDPETSLYGADNAQGLDYYNMPGVKSFMFGIKIDI
jgi:TonB-linked SusC/RagA family outer membrane protein